MSLTGLTRCSLSLSVRRSEWVDRPRTHPGLKGDSVIKICHDFTILRVTCTLSYLREPLFLHEVPTAARNDINGTGSKKEPNKRSKIGLVRMVKGSSGVGGEYVTGLTTEEKFPGLGVKVTS